MHSVEGCGGSRVLATDGMLGRIVDLLFDEEKWVIRYLVVRTGDWLASRKVLISPYSVRFMDAGSRMIVVSLTRSQVADSPPTLAPYAMTSQEELSYCTYFGYPVPAQPQESSGLCSCSRINGFSVEGTDGSLGRVDDLLFDERTWAIRQVVVSAGPWLAARRLHLAPEWIRSVSWTGRRFAVGLKRADLRRSTPGVRVPTSHL